MTTNISEMVTRTRFVRRAVARALALGLVVACPGGVAAQQEPETVYYPAEKDPTFTLKDAIIAAHPNGTIIIRKGTYKLGPGPDKYESYQLLDGQKLKGVGFGSDGKPLSNLKFIGPYSYKFHYALGLWAGNSTRIEGLGLSFYKNVHKGSESDTEEPFVAPIVAFGDKGTPKIARAVISNNYITNFPRYGIYLTNCTGSEVSKNTIIPSMPGGLGGIVLSDFIGDANNNNIVENRIGDFDRKKSGSNSKNIIALQYGVLIFHADETNSCATAPINGPSCAITHGEVTHKLINNNHNKISYNEFAGIVTESGIALADCSQYNEVFDNNLSKLTAQHSQVRLCGASNDNDLKNNTLGSIDLQSADPQKAALSIEGSMHNTIEFNGTIKARWDYWFQGSYPGWITLNAVGGRAGWVYLDSKSADNKITASILRPKKIPPPPIPPWVLILDDLPFPCDQVLDQGSRNTYTGQEACLAARTKKAQ